MASLCELDFEAFAADRCLVCNGTNLELSLEFNANHYCHSCKSVTPVEYSYQTGSCTIRDFSDSVSCQLLKQVARFAVGRSAQEALKGAAAGNLLGPAGTNNFQFG